jgi:hypothetical protein
MGDGERIGLTLWDSDGLDKMVVDLQLREMLSFLESKFEETFNEENKVVRSPGVRDTHIHCVFLVLDPLRLDANLAKAQKAPEAVNGRFSSVNKSYLYPPSPGANAAAILEEDLDLQVLRTLQGKTTVIPIISKADTLTTSHMADLKGLVYNHLKQAGVETLEALEQDADDSGESDEEGAAKVPKHKKHNSKIFSEKDEDAFLNDDEPISHLDSDSSSAESGRDLRRASSSALGPDHAAANNGRAGDEPKAHPYLPLSILTPSAPSMPHAAGVGQVGRHFPWGTADPYNESHCDFVRLRDLVFKEWRGVLREASREIWYEAWRESRLNGGKRRGKAAATGNGAAGAHGAEKAVGAGRGQWPRDDEGVVGVAR